MTSQPIPPFKSGTATISIAGKTAEFSFPDTGDMRAQLDRCFKGLEYPRPPIPDFAAEHVVDVGANVGATALFFHGMFPSARVVCFEPSPTNFAYLMSNTRSFPKVECYSHGLGAADSTVPLYVGKSQFMQNSIVPNASVRANVHETATIRRASAEFDRLRLEHVSILKIDTEGCELQILADLGERLLRVDVIYVEYHSEDDRLSIDGMLRDRFVLANASAREPHRGTNGYVSRSLVTRYPALETFRIGS